MAPRLVINKESTFASLAPLRENFFASTVRVDKCRDDSRRDTYIEQSPIKNVSRKGAKLAKEEGVRRQMDSIQPRLETMAPRLVINKESTFASFAPLREKLLRIHGARG